MLYNAGMGEEPKRLGRLFMAAIVISIPSLLMTVWGVWLGGWPMPGRVAPIHPRLGTVVDEVRWRERKARELNDPALWNDRAEILLRLTPSERSAEEDYMVKENIIGESSRLRLLTPAEQTEMEKSILAEKSRNTVIEYGLYWLIFGMPLSLLAMLLGSLALVRALWRQIKDYRLVLAGGLVLLNSLVLLLTYWNASGTSLD